MFLLAWVGAVCSPHHVIAGCSWTQPQGPDLIAVDQSKPGLVIREYVPANSVVTLFLTSNGEVIKNANNTAPHWQCDNTDGDAGFTDTFDKLKHVTAVNGKPLTDINQRTERNPAGTLQAAAFDGDGSMFELGPWLFDSGFVFTPLGVPDFWSPTLSELFFGVRLEEWAAENVVMSVGDVGSRYEVVNGLVVNKISGSGPSAAQLQSFLFGTAELSADPIGGWTGALYTGEAELFGWHELETVPEPELMAVLIITAMLSSLLPGKYDLARRRRR